MFLLLRLSLRNLFRQKRRNILLGSAMAIGVMLLVMSNSFSHGISDIMMNKILRWVTGHVSITFNERGRMMTEVFRDKNVFNFLGTDFKDYGAEVDEAVGGMARVIGNGRAENMILVGINLSAEASEKTMRESEEMFRIVEGNWDDLRNPAYENPVIISRDKARDLNVKLKDILRLRLRNIFGQDQSARVTVVGTITTANIFMGPVMFGEVRDAKKILGFDEHSTGNYTLVLRNPERDARTVADAIHARLNSQLAVMYGQVKTHRGEQWVTALGYNSDPSFKEQWGKQLKLVAGDLDYSRLHQLAWISQPLAGSLGVGLNDSVTVVYTDKWGQPGAELSTRVGAIFDPGTEWGSQLILVEDERFYEAFYSHWPQVPPAGSRAFMPGKDHPAYALLSPEWILLPRTATYDEMAKKYREMGKRKWRSTLIDVRTMYETGDQVLQLEGVLNLITLGAVMVLFFIILIGVVNTLRMTVRERTREIGTVRAIGMQRNSVRHLFILETLLLAFFASLAGVLLAFILMGVISHIPMNMSDNPLGMLLVNGHFYFIPTWGGIVGNIILILVLSGITAFFPARHAAMLSPAAALRHFE